MRLFIGISPTEEIRKGLVEAQESLQHHGVTGTYLSPENLHMTLAFIGEYPDVDPVLNAMETVFFSPFEICYTHLGTFRKSIVWGGIEESVSLSSLVKQLRCELARADIPFDNSTFSPHLTLVRHADFIKGIPPVEINPISMIVEKISLYRSDRSGSGMIYTEIGSVEAAPKRANNTESPAAAG